MNHITPLKKSLIKFSAMLVDKILVPCIQDVVAQLSRISMWKQSQKKVYTFIARYYFQEMSGYFDY